MALYSSHTDEQLLSLLKNDDEAAFTELFRRYDKRIYFFALKMIKNETLAEEIVQEIFIKLWNKRDALTPIDNAQAYILTIAANHTLNQIKKHLSEQRMLDRLAALMKEKFTNNVEELLLLHDSETLVMQAVDKLPPQQKRVYLLSRQEGLNYEEIADKLNISRNTVRNHLVEALRSIRYYIDEQGKVPVTLLALAVLLMKN
jgi:RNA polymerase sigma-70 factor (ECF subfamily)